MKVIFEELVKGNLPGEGKFSVEKGEKYYLVYCNGNPRKDRIFKFNSSEANSENAEKNCKKIFEFFGHRLDEERRKWHK